MMCDTCTNRMYCENEERQMCIANDYDRYDDDGLQIDLDDEDYDEDIDVVKTIFKWLVEDNTDKGTKVLSDCCSAVTSMIDLELGNLMLRNILRTAGTCNA